MYELTIKILGENNLKKYTIQEIEEMKQILLDVKTEEVRLKRIENNEHTRDNKMVKQI